MSSTTEAMADARRRLARFGPDEALPGGAPVYARLAEACSDDEDLVRLLASAPRSQRRATLFFAGAHYLMLGEHDHPLWAWFSERAGPGDPFPDFRAFCLERADELEKIFASRKTQTNEAQRSSYLVPIFGIVFERASKPLGLIEPGAAAGLNLLFDRFFYDYADAGSVGDPVSPVRLAPKLEGSLPVPVPASMPEVVSRVGIDLEPVDLMDSDAVRWLRACVWAEHRHRAETLERAVGVARGDPPEVIEGDAIDILAPCVEQVPAEATLCVFHTNVMPYLDESQMQALVDVLRDVSMERDVYWVASEGWSIAVPLFGLEEPRRSPGTDYSMLAVLTRVRRGDFEPRLLARAAPHGQWIEWLDGA